MFLCLMNDVSIKEPLVMRSDAAVVAVVVAVVVDVVVDVAAVANSAVVVYFVEVVVAYADEVVALPPFHVARSGAFRCTPHILC